MPGPTEDGGGAVAAETAYVLGLDDLRFALAVEVGRALSCTTSGWPTSYLAWRKSRSAASMPVEQQRQLSPARSPVLVRWLALRDDGVAVSLGGPTYGDGLDLVLLAAERARALCDADEASCRADFETLVVVLEHARDAALAETVLELLRSADPASPLIDPRAALEAARCLVGADPGVRREHPPTRLLASGPDAGP